MQTLSPTVDRIGAVLKALRRSHMQDGQGEDKLALGAQCLRAIIAQLMEEGVPPEDLQPLADLEAVLQKLRPETQGASSANRRKGRAPSDVLLARAAAVIDLLIKAGYDESEAGQFAMRRLVAAGVPAPSKGGDARGWKRLLEWRVDLLYGYVSAEAQAEYEDFTRQIEAIPADVRVKRVLDEQLWDRRRKPR
jgi:hypothetical protein